METNQIIKEGLHNWIPYKLIQEDGALLCRWLYSGHTPYTDPFFDETIQRCLRYSQYSPLHKCVTLPGMLPEWAAHIDAVQPTAFICHVSRCGSTLVSQAAGISSSNISLSEVPLFDQVLRLPLQGHMMDEQKTGELLKAAIKFYGAKRNLHESRLFIKTDSWHLLFYQQIRALYPDTPFIIMYRSPAAVLESNKRKKGVQGIPGMVEPALYGLQALPESLNHPDAYMEFVLGKFYDSIIGIARTDSLTLLVNYNEGLTAIMQKIADFVGFELSHGEETGIAERSLYHAKSPGEKFAEKNKDSIGSASIRSLAALYEEIERLRLEGRK